MEASGPPLDDPAEQNAALLFHPESRSSSSETALIIIRNRCSPSSGIGAHHHPE
jgi:hypothetical protein